MPDQSPDLRIAYVGPNAAHRRFRADMANAKALAYVLAGNDEIVLRSFLAKAEAARKESRDGKTFAIFITGRATTTAIQAAIHVTGNEIDLIAAESGGFVSQALALVYREAYRVFETFLVDLFEEVALRDKRILFSSRQITHEEALRPPDLHRHIAALRKGELTRVGLPDLEEAFTHFGLPIVPVEQQDVHRRLRLWSALRNIIEHNGSVVDERFVALVPNSPYNVGDRIAITTPELGDALWAGDWTADQLNKRAIAKFGVE
jgi:hypothetical protein